MQKIKLFIEGFIIGIGKIMPGVSGSVMAITFGIYEKLIESLSSFNKFKKNLPFISFIFLGVILAILVGSNAIKFLLINHYTNTIIFFIGMMIPGIFPLIKNVDCRELNYKKIIICTLVILGLFLLNIINIKETSNIDEPYLHTFLSLIMCGILDAASTVIPGISGSALLMLVGYYERIITSLANMLTLKDFFQSVLVLIPFLIGIILGLIITSKLITYLFKHHRALTYMLIIVFAVFSIISLFSQITSLITSTSSFLTALIFLLIGSLSTYFIEKIFKNN